MAKAKGKKTAGKKAPAKKAGAKKAPAKQKKAQTPKAPKEAKDPKEKVSKEELDGLRKPVEVAKASLDAAHEEARKLTEKAKTIVTDARHAYQVALVPYRDACKKAGVECEFGGGRSMNVSEKVSFLVEKTDKGIRIMVKGRSETEEVVPMAKVKESLNKVAYGYTDKHLGPREEVGNKGGSLSNRLRAVLAG